MTTQSARTRGEFSLVLTCAAALALSMVHTQSSLAGCNAAGKIFTAITIDNNDIPTYLCVDGSETVSVSVNGVNGDGCNITLEVKDSSTGDVTITPAQATATVGGPDASFTVTGAGGGALILVATIVDGIGSPCTDESEEFTVLDVDLDGEEPDGDGGLDPVDDPEDYSPGILLVSSESKLVVQDPGVDSGTLTLTWPSPLPGEADKKLEIDGDSDGTYEIDCSAVTWPVKLLVKTLKNDGGWAEGDWDYDDYVEVTMTHSALAGCADEVKLTIIKVDTETVATVPSDRARKKLGVGEEVTLTFKPTGLSPVTWSLTGDGTLSGTTGGSVTFTAHDRASTPSVTATHTGHDCTVDFTVVEPSGVSMQREAGTDVRHVFETGSVGFKGRPYLTPVDVSFGNIQIRESSTTGVGTGYFAGDTGDPHAQGNWRDVGDGDSDTSGSKALWIDQIYTGENYGPFSNGTFLWAIPWQFRVGTGTEKTFTTVNHFETIDGNGDMTLSKGGHSEPKAYSDPSSSW